MTDNTLESVTRRFDNAAAEWDANPTRIALAKAITETIRNTVPLHKRMRVMDFGAGTGLVTLALLPYVSCITAVDASAEMLKMLKQKANALNCTNVKTIVCDIGTGSLLSSTYDLIVSSMVLHHIPDVPETIRRLRPCLRPGGWIALADLDSEDGSFHPDRTGVYHNGFKRAEVCRWLEDAGFIDVTSREAHRIVRPAADGKTREYPVFLVTGRVS